jgi:alkylation response protein AidB-like acyl-CoA dehydrogenase
VLLSTPSYGVMSADSYLFERSQTIYGGTSEIQRNIIWKSLIR